KMQRAGLVRRSASHSAAKPAKCSSCSMRSTVTMRRLSKLVVEEDGRLLVDEEIGDEESRRVGGGPAQPRAEVDVPGLGGEVDEQETRGHPGHEGRRHLAVAGADPQELGEPGARRA